MNSCDLDGDGKIDYAEFIQAAIDHKHLLNKQNLEIAFNMFDLNHDGQISISELKSMFSDNIINSSSGDEMVNKIMSEVDKNHDNVISHEEFNDAMTEILRQSVKEMLEREK